MKSDFDVSHAMEQYADMVQRICLLHLKNAHDTADIFQNVFLKYCLYTGEFESADHEKAWFIRVTINACKDFLKSFYRKNTVPLDVLESVSAEIEEEQSDVLECVLSLPAKYKDVVYLYYYEGYSALEIASLLHKKENTVYTLLARARSILKEKLGGIDYE